MSGGGQLGREEKVAMELSDEVLKGMEVGTAFRDYVDTLREIMDDARRGLNSTSDIESYDILLQIRDKAKAVLCAHQFMEPEDLTSSQQEIITYLRRLTTHDAGEDDEAGPSQQQEAKPSQQEADPLQQHTQPGLEHLQVHLPSRSRSRQ